MMTRTCDVCGVEHGVIVFQVALGIVGSALLAAVGLLALAGIFTFLFRPKHQAMADPVHARARREIEGGE